MKDEFAGADVTLARKRSASGRLGAARGRRRGSGDQGIS